MDQGFQKLEAMLASYETRVRAVENNAAGFQPVVSQRVDAAWKKIDEHSSDISNIKTAMIDLIQTNKVLKWMLSIFAAVLISIIIAFATGRLQIVVAG